MSTKAAVLPTFKGATLKLYNMLKTKNVNHAALVAFRKANKVHGVYQIMFRLRKIGLASRAFTLTATGDTKPTRTYRIVSGVAKGVSASWPKPLPTRKAATTKAKPASKVPAKPAAKPTSKKTVAKKMPAKRAAVPVAAGVSDDDIVDE